MLPILLAIGLAIFGTFRLTRSIEAGRRLVAWPVFVLAAVWVFTKLVQMGLLGAQQAPEPETTIESRAKVLIACPGRTAGVHSNHSTSGRRLRQPLVRLAAGVPHRGPEPVQFQPANRVRAGRQQR